MLWIGWCPVLLHHSFLKNWEIQLSRMITLMEISSPSGSFSYFMKRLEGDGANLSFFLFGI